MNCARCGHELEIGIWEGMPAIEPCPTCTEVPDDYGYCGDCNRGDCDDCDRRDCADCHVEEEAFLRGAESRQVDVDNSYDSGYEAGRHNQI